MIYYIYKINFLCGEPKGRYYIGKHVHNTKHKDSYTGSGLFCRSYFEKYGKIVQKTYTKEILCYCSSKEELALKEKEIIGNLYVSDPLCTNMIQGGEGCGGWNKGSHSTKGTRQKLSESHKGQIGWFKGKHLSEEHKRKIREATKKTMCSSEIRNKLSESHKGNHLTEETKYKISKAMSCSNNPFYDKHHSKDTKQKISKSLKGKHWKLVNGKRVYY
jgi:hypothetical protein